MVSTHLKNISQIGSFPQVGVKIKMFETTSQVTSLKQKLLVEFSIFCGSTRSSHITDKDITIIYIYMIICKQTCFHFSPSKISITFQNVLQKHWKLRQLTMDFAPVFIHLACRKHPAPRSILALPGPQNGARSS